MSRNVNKATAQTLADWQQQPGLASITRLQITIRPQKVTANCRYNGRTWGSRGRTQDEAIAGLLNRIGIPS